MGYRSDIAFCISANHFKLEDNSWTYDKAKFKEMVGFFKLTEFYEVATSPDYNLIKDADEDSGLGWRDGEIIFYARQWKWYSDYPLVIAFQDMWERMQEIEGISGYLCRVGEGDGDEPDIDTAEFGDDPQYSHFGVITSMYFNNDQTLGVTQTDEEEQTSEAQTDSEPQPDCAGANHATQEECGEAQN